MDNILNSLKTSICYPRRRSYQCFKEHWPFFNGTRMEERLAPSVCIWPTGQKHYTDFSAKEHNDLPSITQPGVSSSGTHYYDILMQARHKTCCIRANATAIWTQTLKTNRTQLVVLTWQLPPSLLNTNNFLQPRHAIWSHEYGSTLSPVMACC